MSFRTKPTDEFETYQIGTCENCHKENVKIRRIEAFSMFARASRESSRGFYNICFECFGPRVKFRSRGRIFYAPTNIIRTPEGLQEFQSIKEEATKTERSN